MAERSVLYFHGGAGSVTGSNFELEDSADPSARFLIDCGLFQGCRFCEEANWKHFPFDPVSIHTLIVTHAHIDHIGRIPKLVKEGFRGRILSTEATKALAEPMLLDSMELLEEDAQAHGRDILYDRGHVAAAMGRWETAPYYEPLTLPGGYTLEFLDAGHILGSSMAKITRGGRTIIFTGDLGGSSPLLPPADTLEGAHYAVMESVYGDRTRKEEGNREELLGTYIRETAKQGGTLLIPAFSTERTQDILFEMRDLFLKKKVPSMPVYLDSPLGQTITEIFLENASYFKKDIRERVESGENIFAFPGLVMTEGVKESRAAAAAPGPKILIAGSGMSAGGRVLAHEKEILPDKRSTLLIVGYQAPGSLGRKLLEGAASVTIALRGSKPQKVPVRCKVASLLTYSAHLDSPHLFAQAKTGAGSLEKIFVAMGEPSSAGFLAERIRRDAKIHASVPNAGDMVELKL